MFFKPRKKPLLSCDIVHTLPGRIRIHCRALGFLDDYKLEIRDRLLADFAVTSVVAATGSESLLINFDADKSNSREIMELVEAVMASYSTVAYKIDREIQNKQTVQERRLHEEPLSEMLMRIGINTATLTLGYFRRPAPPVTLFQKLTNLNAITAMSLSRPIFSSGFDSLRLNRRPNADTLSAAAILASLLSGKSGSSLTIILLADIAELMTAYTMERTRSAIVGMMALEEQFVWKVGADGKETRVPLDDIVPGDLVAIHTGSKIPVDGKVHAGEASIDEASLTGEFMPAVKAQGDSVYAGSTVKSGTLTVEAERVGDDRAISRIVHLVEEAQSRKAPIQAYADRFSAQFIPINFALALIVYMITRSPTRALNMLIIDYSCGVRLSTATAFAAAVCRSAAQGVLVKGGNFIEILSEADTLILDKTGTITEGRPKVSSVYAAQPDVDTRDIVEAAAACEETTNHPIALAIINKVREMGWQIPRHSQIKVHLGKGVETTVNRRKVRVGSDAYLKSSGVAMTISDQTIGTMQQRGEKVIYVARGRQLMGVIGIQDSLREDMKKTLNRLRRQGYDEIVLLTGDIEAHANVMASKMSVDSYKAEALPEEKAEKVLLTQAKGNRVVMVGDGVNDAPALAYADVGISLGSGSTEISIETADIAINNDNPLLLPGIIGLSQKTMQIVRQNFATAIGVNTIGLILASMGVLPVFWAAVLHNATTIAVVSNSARILLTDIEKDI
ncbi:MAG: cation-translocating P-type ATPase [Desulfobacterales bacterium]|nr:cation-translocating P-type ATPase [Desulfobacterales bacterium]